MTVNNSKSYNRDNGPRAVVLKDGLVGNATKPPVDSDLDSVCRSVTELAKAAPTPPLRVKLQHGQTVVEMEWADSREDGAPRTATAGPQPAPAVADPPPAQPPPDPEDALRYVCAPMVGTFYHSPEPDAPPYISVGDVVRPGQPVGILEVMKMMSPVEADVAGRVVEILVPNAHSVEFQQRLIAVEPLSGEEPAAP